MRWHWHLRWKPEMELVGVTTVFQNTEKRARIARKMLSLWGRDVPFMRV